MARRPPGKARRGPRRRSRTGRLLSWLLRRAGLVAFGLFLFAVLWVGAYRVVNPPTTALIEAERWRLGEVARDWRDLEEMAPAMALAALAAEDARFCAHRGFDFEAIRKALEERETRGRLRGASTISQQVAKNVFLWPGRSWLRKGLEAGFTVLVEAFWPKRRIVEVYLNVAETGIGTFGAEAAAQRYFGVGAEALTTRQAALIAAALPNPQTRDPARPSGFLSRRAGTIAHGVETLRVEGAECLG